VETVQINPDFQSSDQLHSKVENDMSDGMTASDQHSEEKMGKKAETTQQKI